MSDVTGYSLTLFIIANENHLPQRRLVPGQYWQVISGLDLTRFIHDDCLDRDDLRETTLS